MFNHIDLEFEELVTKNENGERKYVTPDGNFPSITTILSRKKAKFFKEWRERIGAEEANKITTKATRRGTGMHTVVENYIANEEDYFKKAFPNVKSLFNSIKPIIDDNIDNIAGIEVPLWSKKDGLYSMLPKILNCEDKYNPNKQDFILDEEVLKNSNISFSIFYEIFNIYI